jgi:hypothetical protein
MGNQQSKAIEPPSKEKDLHVRVRALRINGADDSNNLVTKRKPSEKDARPLWEPQGLPVQLTESWQSVLLGDPKNR